MSDADLARPVLPVEVAHHPLLSFHLLKEAFFTQDLCVLPMPSPQPLLLLASVKLELEDSLLPQDLNVFAVELVQGVNLIIELVFNLLSSVHDVLLNRLLNDLCLHCKSVHHGKPALWPVQERKVKPNRYQSSC